MADTPIWIGGCVGKGDCLSSQHSFFTGEGGCGSLIGKAFAGRFGIIAISRDCIIAPLKIVSRGIGYDTASIARNGVIDKAEVVDVRPAELNPGTSVIDYFIVV
jgi:hypothetical protein